MQSNTLEKPFPINVNVDLRSTEKSVGDGIQMIFIYTLSKKGFIKILVNVLHLSANMGQITNLQFVIISNVIKWAYKNKIHLKVF